MPSNEEVVSRLRQDLETLDRSGRLSHGTTWFIGRMRIRRLIISDSWLKWCYGNSILCALSLTMLLPQAFARPALQDSSGRFSEALRLVRDGRYADAEASLTALVDRQPSAEGFELLGNICEQQNKLDRAEDAYRKALKLNAARHSSKIRLGIVYGKKARYAECVEALNAVQNEIQRDPEALFYLCRAFLEVGNTMRGLETAAMVERFAEKDPGAVLSVGRLLVSKDLYQAAVPMLKKAAVGLPKSSEASYSLAFALFKMQQYGEMSIYLDQAEKLDPVAPRILLLRALSLLDTGKFPAAKDYIRKAQAQSPKDKFAEYLWTRVLIEERNYPEAIKRISDLITTGYNDPNAHLSLIAAFRLNGEFQKALDQALKMTKLFPDNPSAHLRAGLELEFLGEYQQAEKFLKNAVTLAPNDPAVLTAAKFTLARISAKEGNDADAVRLLEDVIGANPKDVEARVELADIQHKSGEYEAAEKVLKEALSFNPRSGRAHFLLGKVLTRLGKTAEAEQHFKTFEDLEKSGTGAQSEKSAIYTPGQK